MRFEKPRAEKKGRAAENRGASCRKEMCIRDSMGTDYKVDIDGKKYTPQEISAMILAKLKADAERDVYKRQMMANVRRRRIWLSVSFKRLPPVSLVDAFS